MKTKSWVSLLMILCIMASAIMPVNAGVTVGGGSGKNEKSDTAKRTTSGGTADNLASQNEVDTAFRLALGGSADITVVEEWDGKSPLQTRGWWADRFDKDVDTEDMPDWLRRPTSEEDDFERGADSVRDTFAPMLDAARLAWVIETISDDKNIQVAYVLTLANTTWTDTQAIIACDGKDDDSYLKLVINSETGEFSIAAKGERVESFLGTAQQYQAGDDENND